MIVRYLILGLPFAGIVFFWVMILTFPAQTVNGASTNLQGNVTVHPGVPLAVDCTSQLDFAAISVNASGSDQFIILNPGGKVTFSSTNVWVTGTPSPAQCDITGQPNAPYVIELPSSMTVDSVDLFPPPSDTLTVVELMSLSSGNGSGSGVGLIRPDGTDILSIGGKVLVPASAITNTAPYQANATFTVHY